MTTKTDITRQIEELLGSEGSPELAAAMLERLEAVEAVTFDAARGYQMTDTFDAFFDAALTAVANIQIA